MNIEQHKAIFKEMVMRKPEEIDAMANSGMFNSIIKGYALLAMEQAGVDPGVIESIDFYSLFDEYTATEARERAEGGR